MTHHRIQQIFDETGWVLADGATGTNLFRAGLETGYPPELWNVERPEDVAALHNSFIDAGAQLILTNSFGGTAHRLRLHGAEARVAELNEAAARIARKAGDLLWIETMSSLEEIKAAIEAAAAVGLPAATCMTFDTAARSMMGITPADFASQSTAFGAAYIGANCGIGPAELLHSVSKILVDAKVPVIAKGNCGIPAYVDGAIHYHGTPELMAAYACFARDAGVTIIGGCCGTTEVHVRAMRTALESVPRRPFDQEAADAALGVAWKDVPTPDNAGDTKQSTGRRRGRRRDRG